MQGCGCYHTASKQRQAAKRQLQLQRQQQVCLVQVQRTAAVVLRLSDHMPSDLFCDVPNGVDAIGWEHLCQRLGSKR